MQEATVVDVHPYRTRRDHPAPEAGRRVGAGHPARDRGTVEADLRDTAAMRGRLCTGDRRADVLFGELIDRRVNRLLDELLEHLRTA